jgi:KaiC/GvpD/RAD55 family RecA-like ATPase
MPRDRNVSPVVDLRRLPGELEQFLSRDAYSLVVKGKAGTGKTALALTILSKSLQKQNCLYISSRLAISELFEYYPWVRNFVGVPEDKDSKSDEKTELAPFVDARLDEPQSLFERITNQLMDASSPLIVIDTWDAVGDFMDKEALMTNAKILQIWRQRARAKLIFVLESVEEVIFDNLVDGVIELEEGYVNHRRTRRIHLSKLRGVKIERPYSFFTLNQGVFHSFDQYDPLIWANKSLAGDNNSPAGRPTFTNNGGSANTVEDILNGSIPKHAIVNVELDPTIGSKSILPFIIRMIAGYSRKNDAMITLVPPKGVTREDLDLLLNAFVSNSRQRKRVEVLYQTTTGENKNGNLVHELESVLARNKSKEKGHERLGVLTLDPLGDRSAPSELDELIQTLILGFDSSIIVTRSSEKYHKVTELSDVRLKIVELEGNLFVQPENPWANFYAIQNEKDGEIISVRPMV